MGIEQVVAEQNVRHQQAQNTGDGSVENERGDQIEQQFLHSWIIRVLSRQGNLQSQRDAALGERPGEPSLGGTSALRT